MYLDECRSEINGKEYYRALIRESYRGEDGKVKKRTIANISDCSEGEIKAIRLALSHKDDLGILANLREAHTSRQGLSVGSVYLLDRVATRLGIKKALGRGKQAKVGLWQVIATVLSPGSRLHTVRLAKKHAGCEIIGIKSLCEDDLYENLDYLADNQKKIQRKLFKERYKKEKPSLFLYDITSSYLEGDKNYFGEYGYNRDGKKGKKQIVIGLLTDKDGYPVSIDVYPGNTRDNKTFYQQVKKVSGEFGCKEVVMVGDRGMIKSEQIKDLKKEKMQYITGITKPQIKKLIKDGVFKPSLFDNKLAEVEWEEDGEYVRYILRRNPIREKEVRQNRRERLKVLVDFVSEKTKYLREHPRAHLDVATDKSREKAEKLKLHNFTEIKNDGRKLWVEINREEWKEERFLDGCYVIKTDLGRDKEKYSARHVHKRYKDLSKVERAFRTMKKIALKIRPLWVRTEKHTIGKVFITMLAYLIELKLEEYWSDIDETVRESLDGLSHLCIHKVRIKDVVFNNIPEPRDDNKELLTKANVKLPEFIPWKKVNVDTKRKLNRSS